MTENMGKWPSGHRKTERSGDRLAAEKTLFPQHWYGGMISANLEVFREIRLDRAAKNCAAKLSTNVGLPRFHNTREGRSDD